MQFGGGGVVLNFNLKPGDLGWIKASDRDLSLFLQSFKAEPRPTPCACTRSKTASLSPRSCAVGRSTARTRDNAVLQTLDGNSRVAVGPTFVKATFGSA
jgi:hypothetical protein